MIKRTSIDEVANLLADDQSKPVIVDIRDKQSFDSAHMENAIHLSNENVQEFVDNTANDASIVVVCYHGHSSIPAAEFLQNQGLVNVMSMDGGFEAWRQHYKISTNNDN